MKQIKIFNKRNLSTAVFAAALLALTSCFDFSNELVVEGENGNTNTVSPTIGQKYTVVYNLTVHKGKDKDFYNLPVAGTVTVAEGLYFSSAHLPVIKFREHADEKDKFDGWYFDATYSESATDINITPSDRAVGGNIELYAKWTKHVLLKYDMNLPSGTVPSTVPNTLPDGHYWDGDVVYVSAFPRYNLDRTKEYKFDYWTTDGSTEITDNIKIENYTIPTNGGDAFLTIYAKWTQGYQIEYNDNKFNSPEAGTLTSNSNYYYKDDIFNGYVITTKLNNNAANNAVALYYDFDYWAYGSNKGDDVRTKNGIIIQGGASGQIKLYAKWKEKSLNDFKYTYPTGLKTKIMYTAGEDSTNTVANTVDSSTPPETVTVNPPNSSVTLKYEKASGSLPPNFWVNPTNGNIELESGTVELGTASNYEYTVVVKATRDFGNNTMGAEEAFSDPVVMRVRPAFDQAALENGHIEYDNDASVYTYLPTKGSGASSATINIDGSVTANNDMTIESNLETTGDSAVISAGGHALTINGTLIMNGGTLSTANAGSENGLITANGPITVNSGEINVGKEGCLVVNNEITLNTGATLNITGEDGSINFTPKGKIKLAGGTININNQDGVPVTIGDDNLELSSGSIFVAQGSKLYVADDLDAASILVVNHGTIVVDSGKKLILSGATGATQPQPTDSDKTPKADTICTGTINVNGKLIVPANPLVIKGNGELIFNSGSSAILDAVTLQDTAKVTGGTDIVDETLQKKITSEINSAGGLYEFIKMVNNKQYYSINGRLTDNVACNSSVNANLPIGEDGKPYKGTFDGGGKTLSSMAKDYNGSDIIRGVGLFAETSSTATIENITVECNISGNCYYAGGIVGMNEGTIRNCTAKGTITANSYVGGIAGSNLSSSSSTPIIDGCVNQATVTSTGIELMSSNIPYQSQAGGITAQNTGVIRNCYNRGEIKGANSMVANASIWAGGIAASHGNKTNGAVENCYNVGKVTASTGASASQALAGGICGEATADISACHNIGTISATGPTNSFVGGIAGAAGRAQLTNNPATYALTCKFDCCFVLYGIAVAGASINGEAANIVNSDSVQGNQFGNQSGVGTVVNKLNAWRGANGDYKSWKIGVVSGVFINGVNQYPVLDGMP